MSGPTVPLIVGGERNAYATFVFKLLSDPKQVAPAVSDWIGRYVRKPKTYVKMEDLHQIRVQVPLALEINALKVNGDVPPVITKVSSTWTVSPVWKEYMLHPQTVATVQGALVLRLESTPAVDPADARIVIVEDRPGYPKHFKVDFKGERFTLPVSLAVQYAVWNAVRSVSLEFLSVNRAIQNFARDVYMENHTVTKYKENVASLLKGTAISSVATEVAENCVSVLADYMAGYSQSTHSEFKKFLVDAGITTMIPQSLRQRMVGRKRKTTTGAFADLCA